MLSEDDGGAVPLPTLPPCSRLKDVLDSEGDAKLDFDVPLPTEELLSESKAEGKERVRRWALCLWACFFVGCWQGTCHSVHTSLQPRLAAAEPCCALPCLALPCPALPCPAVLCCAVLCCAVLP